MNQTYFCNTSGVIKLYHQEIGTNLMEAVFSHADSTVIISELTSVEIHSALAKKVRMKEITTQARSEAILNFRKDCREKFVIAPMDLRTLKKARAILDKHGTTRAIRTLDALQLAACILSQEVGSLLFVCADVNLNKICELEGIEVLNPELQVTS